MPLKMSKAASSTALEGITRMMSAGRTHCVKLVGHKQLMLRLALTAGGLMMHYPSSRQLPSDAKLMASLVNAWFSMLSQGYSSVAEQHVKTAALCRRQAIRPALFPEKNPRMPPRFQVRAKH